jgi:hypothetical protein
LPFLPLIAGIPTALLTLYFTRFRHHCNYVGERGIAAFACAGNRDNITREDLFLFRDAVELRIGQTRNYYNGVYTGTGYNFTWSDENSTRMHQLSGTYRSEAGTPVPSDPYYFALSAEMAWTMYLFRNMDKVMTTKDTLIFGLRGNDFVEIGSGYLILSQRMQEIRFEAEQIAAMPIQNGVVAIHEHGATQGWFSSSGIHSFPYQDLGNARFFLYACEKLLGIRVG